MKKQFVILLILIFSFGVLIKVNAEDFSPSISSVTPTSFSAGETISIIGENFGNFEKGGYYNRVCFGFGEGKVVSWDDNQINVEVPSSVYGPNDSYRNDIGIYTTQKRNESDYAPCGGAGGMKSNSFTNYIVKPKFNYIYPNSGTVGDALSINGAGFEYSKGTVLVNGINSNIISWDPSTIKIIIPDTSTGSGNIVVRTYKNVEFNITLDIKEKCIKDIWECSAWSTCFSSGTQMRTCKKTLDCSSAETVSPAITQSCSYAPVCSEDTWSCGNWGACSPQGVQTRSCNRTFDCSSAETASPATSQYCEAPNQPKQQSPTEDTGITNQDSIIKATVKLICPVSSTMASQGSGTVIDSKGTILTNKHVIDGTTGCLVGFIEGYNDEPYFGDRQIADIYKISSDADVAILKLRNPSNRILTSININQGNSSNIKLGEILTTYGYPAKFGTNITFTSGDFSGVDGVYLKTTAIIEHGNSGGGAYLRNGTFIGIPTAVIKGSLNSMGYLLSVNKVNSWLNGSSYAYNSGNNNNYSRVSSLLENIDLGTLDSLGLFVTGDSTTGKTNSTTSNKAVDKNLQSKLKGYILLQVESRGEAWYVNPVDGKRYYMKDGATAYQMMRNFGLGIANINLAKLPKENEKNNNPSLTNSLKGKILLQVEEHGEAWYVNPKTGYRHYMKDGEAAYSLMRYYSLGISNKDLEKIPIGDL